MVAWLGDAPLSIVPAWPACSSTFSPATWGSADNLQPVEEGRPWDAVAMRVGWPGVATGSFSTDKIGTIMLHGFVRNPDASFFGTFAELVE